MTTIICPNCGQEMNRYGARKQFVSCPGCEMDLAISELDNWEDIYPTYEQVMGIEEEPDEDDTGEIYDEVFDELSRD